MRSRKSPNLSAVLDRFRSDNPLLVRKKFQMKDVCFRRDQPDVELLRWEFAWDVELYVLLLTLSAAAALLILKTVACCRRARRRRSECR